MLVVGATLNAFIRRADRVKIACIAQLVNVIAPIMTENGGPAWRQTTYWPLYYASLHGRGESLGLAIDSPTYDAKVADDVPYLDVAAVKNDDGKTITFFLVNRHPDEALSVDIGLAGFAPTAIAEHITIENPDLHATNTAREPDRVGPKRGKGVGHQGWLGQRSPDAAFLPHAPRLGLNRICRRWRLSGGFLFGPQFRRANHITNDDIYHRLG